MGIVAGVATDFFFDAFEAIKTDTFKIALYESTADLDKNTVTAYTTTGEISGTGYVAGGATLTGVAMSRDGNTIIMDFDNPSWPGATFSAAAALVYNSTDADQAIAVLDLGGIISASAETFTIKLPLATSAQGAIRLA